MAKLAARKRLGMVTGRSGDDIGGTGLSARERNLATRTARINSEKGPLITNNGFEKQKATQ